MQAYIVKSLPPTLVPRLLLVPFSRNKCRLFRDIFGLHKQRHTFLHTFSALLCTNDYVFFFLNLVYLGDYWCRNRVSIYLQLWGILLYE